MNCERFVDFREMINDAMSMKHYCFHPSLQCFDKNGISTARERFAEQLSLHIHPQLCEHSRALRSD